MTTLSGLLSGFDDVVPIVAMKGGPRQVQFCHLLIRNRNAGRIGILIKFCLNGQTRVSGGVAD